VRQTLQDRFEKKVEMIPFSDCHHWTAATNKFGYGKISVSKNVWKFAHRISWEFSNGDVPEGMCVLHTCDNPRCVNPNHLYLGSHKDNAQDRERRQRGNQPKGSASGRSKLSADQVFEIRKLYCSGKYSYRKLGKMFGVDGKSIADIVNGRNWTHLH
jgi:hypothetical protein